MLPDARKNHPIRVRVIVSNFAEHHMPRTGVLSHVEKDLLRNRKDCPDERNKKTRRTDIITGTAEPCNRVTSPTFASAVRHAWLYVGRVGTHVREEDVAKYLQEKFPNENFLVTTLPKRENAHSVAFKVGADMDLLDDLSRAETWPRGVLVKRFRFFRDKQPNQ